jgi:hypothetical protein
VTKAISEMSKEESWPTLSRVKSMIDQYKAAS